MNKTLAAVETTPFADLATNPAELGRVMSRLEEIIWASFGIDAVREQRVPTVTVSETKRRFEICEKWIRVMRGDMRYSWIRTMDVLPHALRCELDGIDWVPRPIEEGWAVHGNTKLMVADTSKDLAEEINGGREE